MKLSALAEIVHGTLIGNDREIADIVTDSRKANAESLLVALIGARFDAHDFCADSHAGACLVSRQLSTGKPQVVVADTEQALAALGQHARLQAKHAKVTALTGSAGKTTTRELLAQMMRGCGEGVVTQGNFNNDIGVPLTLLRFSEHSDWGVIECGASQVGDIARIAPLAAPQVTILLNAMDAHIGRFGSLANIRQGKGEIISAASEMVVLNQDDPAFLQWRAQVPAGIAVRRFSRDQLNSDAYVSDVTASASDTRFTVHLDGQCYPARLAVPGEHLLANFLAALLAATWHGVAPEVAIKQAEDFSGFSGRMQFVSLSGQRKLIDDSYNASPASVYAAIDVLAKQGGHRILALGDLAELGDRGEPIHQEIGRYARGRVDELLTVGTISRLANQAFGANAVHFEQRQVLVDQLGDYFVPHSTLLIKGARSAAMDLVGECARSLWSKT